MLFLGIDQHKRKLSVNLRGEDGTMILQRQVGMEWERKIGSKQTQLICLAVNAD